jgi:molecular chaperone GrpE (heat shock protein)
MEERLEIPETKILYGNGVHKEGVAVDEATIGANVAPVVDVNGGGDSAETEGATESEEIACKMSAVESSGGEACKEEGAIDVLSSGDNGIGEKFDVLKQDISALRELTENISFRLEHNKRKEELIDKLHTENQGYKNGMYQKLVMPFVNENIFLIDNYTKLVKGYESKDASEIGVKKLLRQLGDIVEDLENSLYKNGIEAYEAEIGTPVDFSKQKIIKTVPTEDLKKDKTVCESLKKGFILDEKIIRQEQISCYKYEEKNIKYAEKE